MKKYLFPTLTIVCLLVFLGILLVAFFVAINNALV